MTPDPERNVRLGSGQFFGGIGVFPPSRVRTGSAVCVSAVTLYRIDKSDLVAAFYQSPALAFSLGRMIVHRMEENLAQVESALPVPKEMPIAEPWLAMLPVTTTSSSSRRSRNPQATGSQAQGRWSSHCTESFTASASRAAHQLGRTVRQFEGIEWPDRLATIIAIEFAVAISRRKMLACEYVWLLHFEMLAVG